jgi:hypothetical protein
MKKEYRMIVLMGLAAFSFIRVLQAEDRDRIETVQGLFQCVTKVTIGDHVYTGIDIKPFDRDHHVLVLIPDNHKELIQTAKKFTQDTRLDVSYVTEEGKNFIRDMKATTRRETREEGPEGEEKVISRSTIFRTLSEDERPESRRTRGARRDSEPRRPRGRENRQDREPKAQLDQLQRQLREVVSGHLDRMSRSIRDVMADHLWRMDAEFRELRTRMDRIERELDRLREENERLRRELRERTRSGRERDEQVRERRENRERTKREETRNNTP